VNYLQVGLLDLDRFNLADFLISTVSSHSFDQKLEQKPSNLHCPIVHILFKGRSRDIVKLRNSVPLYLYVFRHSSDIVVVVVVAVGFSSCGVRFLSVYIVRIYIA
jgi:hypothetical protein